MAFTKVLRGAAAGLALLMLACSGEGYGQRDEPEAVRGTVQGFTEAPKGEIDGLTLGDGTVVHWPPHLSEKFTAVVKKGDRVEVVGRRATLPRGEKVFEARTVINLATKESYTSDDAPPPPRGKKGKDRAAGPDRTVTGKVGSFTEAPKGEIDGLKLDDGTVAHWPPHLAKQFTDIVRQGDRVRVVGWDEVTPRGAKVLEVRSVTNLATNRTRVNEDAPPAGPAEDAGGDLKTVFGRVQRLTESPKGETDGAELADGTLLHWPLHLGKRFAAVAKPDAAVEARGRWEKSPDGGKVLEVRSVTNLKTDETAKNDGPPPPKDR